MKTLSTLLVSVALSCLVVLISQHALLRAGEMEAIQVSGHGSCVLVEGKLFCAAGVMPIRVVSYEVH